MLSLLREDFVSEMNMHHAIEVSGNLVIQVSVFLIPVEVEIVACIFDFSLYGDYEFL